MILSISRKKIENIIKIMTVILIVLLSKTYFFGVVNLKFFQIVFFILTVLGMFLCKINRSIAKRNSLVLSCFIILFLINIIIHFNTMTISNINQIIGFMLFFTSVCFSSFYLKREEFSYVYIIVMAIISFISLICFFIQIYSPELAYSLCQEGYDWTVHVGYSFFHTWGWDGQIFTRNAGPFWEPGAFQGFLVFALIFLFNNTAIIKHKIISKLLFLLFVVTIISTQSTTGFVILILIFTLYFNEIQKLFNDIPKLIRLLIVLLISITVLYVIISSKNISMKLTNTVSSEVRFSDITGGIKLIIRGGIFGLGETNNKEILKALNQVNQNDSCGLFSMTYTFGLLFSTLYLFFMYKGIKKEFNIKNVFYSIVLFMIFIILHMTEGLWFLPLYLIFLFYLK